MNKRFDAIHLALVATIIWDAHVTRRNKARFNALKEENTILWNAVTTSQKQVDYLCNLMNEHGTPVSEFDQIVFHNLS